MDRKTILVIEDDDITRMGFAAVLSTNGYSFALAANGKEAMEYLQSHDTPDLIILDMLMPVMDGWQFLKERDARWSSVPVLVTTALAVASNEWVASLGASCYLQKPINEAVLLAAIEKCLRQADVEIPDSKPPRDGKEQ